MIDKAIHIPYEVVQAFLIANSKWPLEKVQSWMKHYFDPRSMYVYTDQDGQIQAALQLREQTMLIDGQKVKTFMIERFFNPREVSTDLLEELYKPAFEQADRQSLFLIGNAPWLQEKGFSPVDQTLSGSITYHTRIPGSPSLVSPYQGQDLYPVYEQFMQNFDGSVVLDRKEFNNWIHYWLDAGFDILVSKDRKGQVNGFAIIEATEETCTILITVYDQIQALLNLITRLQGFYDTISIQVSQAEDLSQLFEIELKPSGRMFGLSLHPELHKAAGLDQASLDQIIENLELSSWNNLFI